MDNKVNAYLHTLLNDLADDCQRVVENYEYARKHLFLTEPVEFALMNVRDTTEDINKALDVFENAEMITDDECRICAYCAKAMNREAKSMLRKHLKEAV